MSCKRWSIRGLSAAALALSLGLWMGPRLSAQVIPTGSLDGGIRDSSAAVLPGAQVTLVNVRTGAKRATVTNDYGVYYFNLLPPGQYRLEAGLPGFKKFAQTVTVETGRKVTVNAVMEVGEVQETVEVISDAPLLETSTASTSTTVNSRFVSELPLSGRNALQLAVLTAGIVQLIAPQSTYPLDNTGAVSYFSANGASYRMNEFLMDGVPNRHHDRVSYIPPADQVQEFNIQTNSFDAEYGHGGGAYVNVTTKSGTNEIHGSVYEFLRNDAFDANNFFSNRAGLGKPALRYNQFGAAAGGPVFKNKTFWFFNYEGVRNQSPRTGIFTVPTEAQRRGDFSQTFDARGNLIRIYNPFSTRPDPARPGRFIRDQFPGNVMPPSRIDPVARKVIDTFVPLPNRPGDPLSGTNNFAKVLRVRNDLDNFTARLDHTLGNAHRLFGRWSRTKKFELQPQNVEVGGNHFVDLFQDSIGIGDTITINPTTTLIVNAGVTGFALDGVKPDFDLLKLGFDPSFVRAMQQVKVSELNNSDMVFVGARGGTRFDHDNQYSFSSNMTHLRGRHNMKWGFQMQVRQNNSIGSNSPSGRFTFNRGFTQGPDPNTRGSAVGHGIASFLLGTPASGFATLSGSEAAQSPYYGFYFHDDIRISSRLTLNVGLRYETQLPATERFNNLTRWAFDATNPIDSSVRAAYAKNPIPELPVDQFRVLGGLIFASPEDRRAARADTNDWSPRFGLAYQVNNKTVLRAGYGHFYSYWPASNFSQSGFSSSTPMVSTIDAVTPLNLLNNPFPNGFISPPGRSQGMTTLLGTGFTVPPSQDRTPYNERWQFGIQRELTKDLLFEVNYVGETAQSLYVGDRGGGSGGEMSRQLRFLPAQYLSLGSRLQQTVPNPFFGLISPNLTLGRSTISIQNLLSAYPHVSSLVVRRESIGRSYYHGLQATATKRYSHGFQFLSTYTFMRQVEKVQFLNDSDPAPSKAIGFLWTPHRFTFASVWELPFGPGKPLLNRKGAVGTLAGGWQLSAIQTFQSGSALLLPDAVYTGIDPRLPPGERSIDGWFNNAAFKPLPAFTLRTLSTRLARLQGDAINNIDLSVLKTSNIGERFKIQFRWELFNAFNRPQFGAPALDPSSGSYGRVTGQENAPRTMQFGLRLTW